MKIQIKSERWNPTKNSHIFMPILLLLFFHSASAQRNLKAQGGTVSPWEIGISGGASSFVTSVNPEAIESNNQINYWNRDINPGVGLSIARNISPSLGIELNWLNTRLTGSWNNIWPQHPISAGRESPLTFNGQINQFDLMMTFNINQIILPGDLEDKWHFYLKTGVGLANIHDKMKFYPGITYNRFSAALDAGLSFSLSDKIKLQIGSTLRSVNTDNLDGVHVVSTYIDGQTTYFMKVFEIYNYSYLRVSCNLGKFGNGKSKAGIHKIKSRKHQQYPWYQKPSKHKSIRRSHN